MFINCNGKLLSLAKPVVMGIVNLTPDSFYQNSRIQNEKELLHTCEKMLHDGAAMIDIGGYSSRPGADFVSTEEESSRVLESVKTLTHNFKDIILSIDTFRSTVAQQAIDAGAALINDISAGDDDPMMMDTVAAMQVPYIMMHKRGAPKTMNGLSQYDNVSLEVLDYFVAKTIKAQELHIHDIILDVGFGFAKTTDQNYQLLNALDIFRILEKPLLVGISRKKMIQHVLQSDAANALNGTTVANTIALLKGAKILRVHDVKEAMECIKIVERLN
jgi:dihydropteroate synthase